MVSVITRSFTYRSILSHVHSNSGLVVQSGPDVALNVKGKAEDRSRGFHNAIEFETRFALIPFKYK